MDQLSATLDRGWDLAQRGDAGGAAACAKRGLELDPKSPEVHNLLGYSAAMGGNPDEALEHYKQAIALDETYFEAMLNAAEVLMHPLAEWEDAVTMCDDAYALAETDEEIADCLLLKVDALMSKGAMDDAMRVMRLIPEGPFESASYTFLIGRAYYELGDYERATPLIEEAARKDPMHADAQYYLGLVRDERGDGRGATEAFLRTRALDVGREAPTWTPSPDAFGSLVESCIRKLDALLGRYIHEAEVFVVDVPGAELVVDGVDPRALMIIDSSQLTPVDVEAALRDPKRCRIFVYQRNVERAAGTFEQLEDEVLAALERDHDRVPRAGRIGEEGSPSPQLSSDLHRNNGHVEPQRGPEHHVPHVVHVEPHARPGDEDDPYDERDCDERAQGPAEIPREDVAHGREEQRRDARVTGDAVTLEREEVHRATFGWPGLGEDELSGRQETPPDGSRDGERGGSIERSSACEGTHQERPGGEREHRPAAAGDVGERRRSSPHAVRVARRLEP